MKTLTTLAAVICTAVVAGCTSPSDVAGPPSSSVPASAKSWPTSLKDFSIVWSGEPGIDLTTGPAVVVRAYTESYFLAAATGDYRYLYPGFAQAVPHNAESSNPAGTHALWPSLDSPGEFIGTQRDHVLQFNRSDNVITAVVCTYTYTSATPANDASFKAVASGLSNPGPGFTSHAFS